MADAYVLRTMVEAEQQDFASLLRSLTPEQWDAPSLCAGWSVHEVAMHAAWHAHSTAPSRIAQLARVGFNEQRVHEPDRARPTQELIEVLGSPATLFGPTNILTQLSELIIHQQDVRRPLAIHRQIAAAPLATVLDFGITRVGSASVAGARRRAKALRLVATDIGWSAGSGPEVLGPGEAIFMALNGRGDAIADLTGEGTRLLAGRVKLCRSVC
jgi:uncharacterized protein (TIGR03083 family)